MGRIRSRRPAACPAPEQPRAPRARRREPARIAAAKSHHDVDAGDDALGGHRAARAKTSAPYATGSSAYPHEPITAITSTRTEHSGTPRRAASLKASTQKRCGNSRTSGAEYSAAPQRRARLPHVSQPPHRPAPALVGFLCVCERQESRPAARQRRRAVAMSETRPRLRRDAPVPRRMEFGRAAGAAAFPQKEQGTWGRSPRRRTLLPRPKRARVDAAPRPWLIEGAAALRQMPTAVAVLRVVQLSRERRERGSARVR
jgi:hypothetical protein